MITSILLAIYPFALSFSITLILTLILTPIVREFNRKIGMVDKPDPRRINKVPIPRGGGLALATSIIVGYAILLFVRGEFSHAELSPYVIKHLKLVALAIGIVALGYADDKWSLSAKLKLVGQIIVAFFAWYWVGLGFSSVLPWMPMWLDCFATVFWFVGAINAFNLIDGLDGLASGIALIATLGMAGVLFAIGRYDAALFHFAMAGGLLGFLRYNYNPASVFLGDSGSMFIGFSLAAAPLISQTPRSFLVSVGVPLLAMGVPVFDSALAIVRRTIRRFINKQGDNAGNDKVMTADSDHLHHRILRSVSFNQKKAAWILYGITFVAVAFGLLATTLRSRTSGIFLLLLTLGCIVIFKNMARIELYDASRLLGTIAHSRDNYNRRKIARLGMPIYMCFDLLILGGLFIAISKFYQFSPTREVFISCLMIRVVATLFALVLFGTYRTVWSRAMMSNYVRLAGACFLGSFIAGVIIDFIFVTEFLPLFTMSVAYAAGSFFFLTLLRTIRPIVRDFFYALDCRALKGRKDVSRVLVYGAGLRYRSFRRELVRTTSANKRIILGLLDDDYLLRGQRIGGISIEGTLQDAPEVINRLNIDTVIIACVVTDKWMKVIRETLAPTGVKIIHFSFCEKEII